MDFWYELEKRIEKLNKGDLHMSSKAIFEDMERNPDVFDNTLTPVDQPYWSEAERNAANRARSLNTDEEA